MPLLPTYDFMVWTGKTLPLPFTIYFKISTNFYENLCSVCPGIICAQRTGLKGQFGKISAVVGTHLKIVYI
jgi:hypothetical protein